MSSENDADQAAAEETKRKFREALDRKKNQARNTSGDNRDNGGRVGQTHGPAGHQREFRRKSG